MMDLSVVVPCYNEEHNVPSMRLELLAVLGEVAQTCTVELILVDDGSVDGTWDALQAAFDGYQGQLTVKLERHVGNWGLGAALRTGMEASGGEVVVTTDSDGTYRFAEIPALLEKMTPDVDIVTASPYHPRGGVSGVPQWRLLFSRGSALIYRVLVNWHVHTYTALFRAYRRRVIRQVSFRSNGFLGGTELLVRAILMGYPVAEYPTVLHARIVGVSKAKLLRTIRAHLRFQTRVLLHRMGVTSLTNADQAVVRAERYS
jgi:dolichol-phosphate mannosyltransferase